MEVSFTKIDKLLCQTTDQFELVVSGLTMRELHKLVEDNFHRRLVDVSFYEVFLCYLVAKSAIAKNLKISFKDVHVGYEGLSEKFNPEYWNYAKLISGVLRYRMPIEHVIKLVYQLQLTSDNINTWKKGVVTALKRYLKDGSLMKLYDDSDSES
jgi:hypothetical protein